MATTFRLLKVASYGLFVGASLGLLCLPGTTTTASGPVDEVFETGNIRHFVEQEGIQEFSGSMIAKPIQMTTWRSHGLSDTEAENRYDTAIMQISDQFVVTNHIHQTDQYIFNLGDGMTENEVAENLMATGLFKFVEPNWTVYPVDCPDDPRFNQQWHHDNSHLQSCLGWDIHTGTPGTSVGICDTGIRVTHEDLQLHRLEGYNAVDQLWESEGGEINDIYGHGTETTGCAAANGDNGIGVSGVGWNLSHRMLRVTNSGGGGSTIEWLNHAAMTAVENGDKVASLSYSGVANQSVLETATYIKSIGGLMIWAAGNSYQYMNMNDRDADDVIVVGATDVNDNKASWSNYGPFVDFVAPGVQVYTVSAWGDNDYHAVDGTSFACPLTSGLAALIWSANPALTPDEVEYLIKYGCDDIGSPGIDETFGYGRINVFNSMSEVTRPFDFEYPDGLPESVDPNGGTTVRVVLVPQDNEPEPGTGMLHYDDGSGFTSIPMTVIDTYTYDAVFPALDCLSTVPFYFSAETTEGELVTDPRDAPDSSYVTYVAEGMDVVFQDDFEQNEGWKVTYQNLSSGAWTRAIPNGGSGAPSEDFDGSGKCYVTSSLLYSDVDGGPTWLTSPPFAVDADGTAWVSYAYWFYSVGGTPDSMLVDISNNNGQTWHPVVVYDNAGMGWNEDGFDVAGQIQPSGQMKVRFSVMDSPDDSTTEAGVDAFSITAYSCDRMLFAHTPLIAGENATLSVKKADPYSMVYFVYSIAGRGYTYVNGLNVAVDLDNPALAGSETADATGLALLDVSVPNGSAGVDVWLQAVANARKSNVAETTISN